MVRPMPARPEQRVLRPFSAVLTALALSTSVPAVVLAAPAETAQSDSRLAIDCQLSDPEMCSAVEAQVSKDAAPLIKAYESGGATLEPRAIEIVVSETSAVDFAAKLTGHQDGASASTSTTCKACTETELVESISGALADLLPQLSDAARAAGPEDSAEPETPTEAEPPTEPEPETTRGEGRRALGPLGIVGVMGMVAGAGLVGTGIPLALREDQIQGASGSSSGSVSGEAEKRSTRPAGIALASIGGAVLVTGLTLLVVDRVRKPDKKGALLAPSFGPGRIGLGVSGRF